MNKISMIWTNPGSNSSNEMNISFHSLSKNALVELTTNDFKDILVFNSIGVFTPKEYSGNSNYYHHKVTLNNLNENTNYSYRIKCNDYISEVHSFKTASNKDEVKFALIGDIHSINGEDEKIAMVDKLINTSSTLLNGIDFVLGYGDMPLNGINYSDWEMWEKVETLKHYMYAPITGNKEYYDIEGERTTNLWFTSMFNLPKNGVKGLESTYYFLYNKVLFIGLDCVSHEGREMQGEYCQLESQQKWFCSVMEENKGKYEYSIVYRHYPFFSTKEANTEKAYKSWGKYLEWYPLFDKYDIDLVINGDNHAYATSNRLFNNEVVTDNSLGTYYVTGPEIPYPFFDTKLEKATNSLMNKHQRGATSGCMFCSINKDKISLNLLGSYNNELKVFDTIEILNKHKFN